uniref:UDP-glucuronosyltransferase n=1 Tax=Nyssomyia neivai TaxID=330878 RepID=A0A1L8E1A2_9DIPT
MKMNFLFFLCVLPCFVSAANILVLETTPSPSHHIWMKTLLTALAQRGHNVTSLSADHVKEKIPNLHYIHMEKVYEVLYDTSSEDHTEHIDFLNMGQVNVYDQFNTMVSYVRQSFKGMLLSKGYRQLLAYPDDFKFDLVIHDFISAPMLINFVEKFGNPPIIGATAFYSASLASELLGGILAPSYVPYPLVNMRTTNFWGRLSNFLLVYYDKYYRENIIAAEHGELLKKDFPNGADVRELMKRTKIVLLNKHPALDVNEPLMSNVISVGGLQIQRNRGLPEDLQKILDDAKDGVILFSLGTNVKSAELGDARQEEILEAFRALPQYTIIWKFEATSLPVKVPPNVIIRKFVPQSDLLAHPNLRLFISHCGLLSTQEAVWYGVPILGLPIFVDQHHNLEINLKTGAAEQGDLTTIGRHTFRRLIEQMMKDPKYRQKAKERSKIFQDQKENPLERAVWWTEFVLRHPNMTFMRSDSLDLNIPIRHSWDVLAFIFLLIAVVVLIIFKIICYLIKNLCRSTSLKSKRD